MENINTHPKGKIEKSDIVIMIDNMLGVDDGGVQIHHLKQLNIHDAIDCYWYHCLIPNNELNLHMQF